MWLPCSMADQSDVSESSTEQSTSSAVSRRGLMALAGVTGLGLAIPGSAAADEQTSGSGNADTVDGHHAEEFVHTNGSEAMIENLDLGGNKIENVDDVKAAPTSIGNYFSLMSNGTGNGRVQLVDTSADAWAARLFESGTTDDPGPVKFQSPIRGADPSDADAVQPGSLEIQDGVALDNPSIREWNVVDVVEAGGDPTGQTPVDDVLTNNAGSSTIFVFPKGTYTITEPFSPENFETMGLVGKPQATIDVANSLRDPALYLNGDSTPDETDGDGTPSGRIFVDSINIDVGGVNAPALGAYTNEYMDIRNVEVRGQRAKDDSYADNTTVTVGLGVSDPDGFGRVEVRLPDGGEFKDEPRQSGEFIGVKANPNRHRGKLVLTNCYVEGFPNNGYYLKRTDSPGEVHIRNSMARNNGMANIRLSEGDTARNCRVEIDEDELDDPGAGRCIAFWVEQGPALFENIYVDRTSGGNKLIRSTTSGSRATYRNVTVHDDGEGDILDFRDGGEAIVENCAFYDTNTTNEYFSSRIKNGRVTLRNVYYQTTPDTENNRRGIVVNPPASDPPEDGEEDPTFLTVENCHFDVDREAVKVHGTRSRIVGNRFESGDLVWDGDPSGDGSGPGGRIRDNEFTADSSYVESSSGNQHVVEDNWNP